MPGSGNSGTAAGFLSDAGTASGYSWIVRVLPYLQEPIYSDISTGTQKFTVDGWSNTAPFQVKFEGARRHFSTLPLDAVVCPSYRGSTISTACSGISNLPATVAGYSLPRTGYNPFNGSAASPPYGVVITNYVALSATTSLNMPGADTADGTIIPGNGLHLRSVLDGTSEHTYALRNEGAGGQFVVRRNYGLDHGHSSGNQADHRRQRTSCRARWRHHVARLRPLVDRAVGSIPDVRAVLLYDSRFL